MKRLDANLVHHIEHGCNRGDYDKIFSSHLTSIQTKIPETIPPSKRNMYIMLMTALRVYNELYSPLFDADIEQYIEAWLSSQEQDRQSVDDLICSEYGKILNQKIADGFFYLILKDEVTEHDKGNHEIIVASIVTRGASEFPDVVLTHLEDRLDQSLVVFLVSVTSIQ